MGLFNHWPYTNLHELNLDWLLGKVRKTEDEVKEAIETAQKAYDEMPEEVREVVEDIVTTGELKEILEEIVEEGIPHYNATYHVGIWIDDINGSDDNDGLSSDKPVKTLQKAFDVMARKSDGAYMHIISSGNYTINYPVISGAMLHLNVEAPNVTIYWLDVDDTGWTKAFYSDYIHLGGYEDGSTRFHIRGTKNAYLESGKLFARNITFTSDPTIDLGVVGGSFQFQECTFKTPLYLSAATGVLDTTLFDLDPNNTSYTAALHHYNGGTLCIRGTFQVNLTANIPRVISMTGATLITLTNLVVNGHDGTSNLTTAASSCIYGGWTRINTWMLTNSVDRTLVNNEYHNTTYVPYADRDINLTPSVRTPVPPDAQQGLLTIKYMDGESVLAQASTIVALNTSITETSRFPLILYRPSTTSPLEIISGSFTTFAANDVRFTAAVSVNITTGAQTNIINSCQMILKPLY